MLMTEAQTQQASDEATPPPNTKSTSLEPIKPTSITMMGTAIQQANREMFESVFIIQTYREEELTGEGLWPSISRNARALIVALAKSAETGDYYRFVDPQLHIAINSDANVRPCSCC